jgi:hypothetical protein
MGEKRDETPFASLLGERLSSVEFVLNDYVQLRFDGPTLNAYSHPVVTVPEERFDGARLATATRSVNASSQSSAPHGPRRRRS